VADNGVRPDGTHKLALSIAAGLATYGMLDVVMRAITLGDAWLGLRGAALDPGFTGFHIVLLPLSAYLVISEFPTALFRSAWSRRRILFVVLGGTLVLAPVIVAVADARDAVCSRLSPPEVFRDGDLQRCLLRLRNVQLGVAPEPVVAGCSDAALVPSAKTTQDRLAPVRDAYAKRLEFRNSNCSYWSTASWYAMYGAVGSTIAGAFAGYLLFLAFWPLLAQQRAADRFWETYLSVLALIGLWLVLRPLSEWFLSFGQLSMIRYPPILLGLIAAAVAISGWIFYFLRHRGIPQVLYFIVIAISGTIGAISHLSPEWLGWAADVLFALPTPVVFAIYLLLGTFSLLLAWYTYSALAVDEGKPFD
jgi:hypothetical protein